MKTILVPVGGSDTDGPLFETALAAARPFSSHLQFLHVHLSAGQAALNMRHTEFAMGPALSLALHELEGKAKERSVAAEQHVRDFCARSRIELCDAPHCTPEVTASWREEAGHAAVRIMAHARHNDLVVVGRARKPNGLPTDFIERLVTGCGRPVLIAPTVATQTLTGTIMVCWRESAEAARAVAAAMPLLTNARRVVVTSIEERGQDNAEAVDEIARCFSWRGIPVEVQIISAAGRDIPGLLASTAKACAADLVVLGAYGHSHAREVLFGGCTQSFIREAHQPVLLMH